MNSRTPIDDSIEQAIVHQRAGDLGLAAALYRQALLATPAHAVANHNLGVILAQSADPASALEFFDRAVASAPDEPVYWLSHARGLILTGHPANAAALLEQAMAAGHRGDTFTAMHRQAVRVAAQANDAAALDQMGQALLAEGHTDRAISSFERAIASDPDFVEAHFHLGSVYSEYGDVARGFSHYMRRAELIGSEVAGRPLCDLPHKTKHDAQQRDYLNEGGRQADDRPVSDYFYAANGERVGGSAVDPARWSKNLVEVWRSSNPQALVIDGFLTEQALERLREFCAQSTVWRRVYSAGYVGATPEDGFACPLLAQIVEETRVVYGPIIADRPFRYLGGFKYDSALSTGTNTHADNSAINVNLYITPDSANLDPASGGMEIWGSRPGNEDEMRRYNGDEAAAQAFLARTDGRSRRIPYRANRAVIFQSDQLHKTDTFQFREGYLNKRINISMLFGDREF